MLKRPEKGHLSKNPISEEAAQEKAILALRVVEIHPSMETKYS
jgi:hypothetical protein